MKKIVLFPFIICIVYMNLHAQKVNADSSYLLNLNQQIDNYVVKQNVNALDSLYANDFVFSHGSGKVEGKESWLKSVAKNNYPSRQHDSVKVEIHPAVAIVKGNMAIQRVDKDKTAVYRLKYIRVYALRNNRWQMISHNTTHEAHDN